MAVVRAASGWQGRAWFLDSGLRRNDERGGLRRRSAGCCAVRVRAVAEKYSQVPRPRPHPPTSPTPNPVMPAKAGIQCGLCQRGAAEGRGNQHGRGAGGQQVAGPGVVSGFGLCRNDEQGRLAAAFCGLLCSAGPRGC